MGKFRAVDYFSLYVMMETMDEWAALPWGLPEEERSPSCSGNPEHPFCTLTD